MTRGTRLELTWVGKYDQPRLEPRILLEDETKSYCAKERVTDNDRFDNLLIKGDNLLALKALEHQYAGKVKCVFIDPPYNTGSAFEQYDDGMEHSLWLSMMKQRVVLIRDLLCQEGSLWITVDDNEAHYLKVLCDELFGRENFVTSVAWEKDQGRRGDTDFSSAHDHVLLYAKNRAVWAKSRNLLPRTDDQVKRYRNPDNDPRGPWLQGDNGTAKSGSEDARFPIELPSGRVVKPPKGNYWRFSKANFEAARQDGRVHFGAKGDSMPVIKRYLSEVQDGVVPRSWWPAGEAGTNQEAKRDHLRKLFPTIEPFATPKPERLIHRILHIATNRGDLVLDSFAGSGTTGSVAHKMGRRWIMVELGEHCDTHIIPRLHKVIDGADPGGVTEATGWKGGGGFRYCTLAPSLLAQDDRGNWVISKQYNAAMLAQAVCVHEGFVYAPSREHYWLHGVHRDSANTFLWVTTQTLTRERLERLSTEVGEGRHLMVTCLAFKGDPGGFPNLVVKKLPTSILDRCEWGKDDYSLKIAALGAAPEPEPAAADDAATAAPAAAKKKGKKPKEPAPEGQGSLFDGGDKKGG